MLRVLGLTRGYTLDSRRIESPLVSILVNLVSDDGSGQLPPCFVGHFTVSTQIQLSSAELEVVSRIPS